MKKTMTLKERGWEYGRFGSKGKKLGKKCCNHEFHGIRSLVLVFFGGGGELLFFVICVCLARLLNCARAQGLFSAAFAFSFLNFFCFLPSLS